MVKRDRAESARSLGGRVIGIVKLCSLIPLLVVATTASWAQVMSPNVGSVPSGPATNEVLRLTLREAINRAVRYNLGAIESDENTRAARGQRLLALSHLLPQVSAGINENVDQGISQPWASAQSRSPASLLLSARSVTVRRAQVSAKPCSATSRSSASVLRAPPSRPPSSLPRTLST